MRYNLFMKYVISIFLASVMLVPTFVLADDSEDIVFVTDSSRITEAETAQILDKLRAIILQLQIARAQALDGSTASDVLINNSCPVLTRSLYIPNTGSDVSELQTFLRNIGQSVYPEGLITGTFGAATRDAVQRFQVLTNIFAPGQVGYGVVGPVTRKTISEYCENNVSVNNETDVFESNNTTSSSLDEATQIELLQAQIDSAKNNNTNNVQNSFVSNGSISSAINTTQPSQFDNSATFNPNSSSIFLQFLNPSDVVPTTSNTGPVEQPLVSQSFKRISFNTVPSTASIGSSHLVSFTESGFSGFDLVTIEGYKDDIQYFFGSTVPALGTYQITIPEDFRDKDSFTLIIKHNRVIKDSHVITLTGTTTESN